MNSDTLLNAKKINHSFDYPLLNDIEICLKKRQKIAITGESGCGKSTLLHILSGFLRPNSGNVFLFDNDVYNTKFPFIDKIGIIFQAHHLFKSFSAIENLKVSSLISGIDIDYDLLDKFNISHVLNQQIGELSGGQQQRVSIARVLSKKPKIIFADEPTGNLDNQTSKQVINLMFDYVDETDSGIILVTHSNDIAQSCDVIYNLNEQKLTKIIKK